ncbi:helix-turn-helix transcriptional regulator [Halorarius halobius]|uniref:helix-turn-helix transcriptional regulator n=1 Tax=Halorarius halobius TaxID=2962671 RepID=UPI0020CD99C0|nr:hypothetical protein [Halorarius halobius]
MRSGPRFALLCLLLLAAAAPGVVAGQSAAAPADRSAAAPSVGPAVAQTDDGNVTAPIESTTMTIQLRPNGDARWVVTTAFLLENESDREAFQRLESGFTSGDAGVSYDVATFERAAAAGRNATGREMRIERVRYNATTTPVENATVGRLRMTFRWTNFTESSGRQLVVGDAFNTTSGTWLPGLTQRQTLVIVPPESYTLLDIPRGLGAEGGTVTVEGPAAFEPGYLGQLTYERTDPTPSVTDTPNEGIDFSMLGLVGVVVIALGALAVGAYVLARHDDGDPTPGGVGEPNPNGGTDGEAVTRATTGATDPPSGPATDDAADDDDDGPDIDLLSDEERVEYLLEENGGRMKQANIVKETGWSNAKVSQLLSAMDDDGRIDKLRIGRENLISLPDEEIGEFDDE